MKEIKEIDVAIVGGGITGLSAAVSCGKKGLKTVIFDSDFVGGITGKLKNVEGYNSEVVSGVEIIYDYHQQLRDMDTVSFVMSAVESIGDVNSKKGNRKFVELKENGGIYETKTIILATGFNPKTITTNIKGVGPYYNRGILSGGTKTAIIVGRNHFALKEAYYLSKEIEHVNVLYHDKRAIDYPKPSEDLLKRVFDKKNISFSRYSTLNKLNEDIEGWVKSLEYTTKLTDKDWYGLGESYNNSSEVPVDAFIPLENYEVEADLAISYNKAYWQKDKESHILGPGVYTAGTTRAQTPIGIKPSEKDGLEAAQQAVEFCKQLEK